MLQTFADRTAAGKKLAQALLRRAPAAPVIVLGLPRGGVPVAFEVAQALAAPLDVLVVRKIGAPWQPEFALGAIASGGVVIRDSIGVGEAQFEASRFDDLVVRERAELERRELAYRHGRPPLELRGKSAILVDDGLATGSTMLAAVRAARQLGAKLVIAAAPIGSAEAIKRIATEADDVVVPSVPPFLFSIGEWYEDFRQVGDTSVTELLARGAAHMERVHEH
jgi:putative phosphoribosyl transferase